MGTETEHRRKSVHNDDFLKTIDSKKYPDWAVTVCFYKALHLVEMLFANGGKHSNSHRDRHDVLKRDHTDIWMQYLPLYTQSRRARYKMDAIKPATVQYVEGRLANVERIVSARLTAKS